MWFSKKNKHVHEWTKWKIASESDITRTKDDSVVGHLVVQIRQCSTCGFTETHFDKKYIT